jgi:hypothetical protein
LIEKRILSPNGTNNSEGELHGETSIRGARSELISYAQVRRGTWTHRDRRNQARADFTRELYEGAAQSAGSNSVRERCLVWR